MSRPGDGAHNLNSENMRRNTWKAMVPRRGARTIVAAALVSAGVTGCLASTQKEVELGSQFAQQIEQQLPIIRDPEIVRYINVLGDSIARVSDDRSLNWRFNVVDQNEINAFAVPGGHIYIYRGLIERSANMSELAGVIGHEIAHVTKRHSMQQMRDAQRANVGFAGLCIALPSFCQGAGGSLAQLGAQAGFAKFSRDDEAEADRFGVQYVTRAGIDPRGMPSMFRTLLAERTRNPGGVDAWFASHPAEESRVENTEAAIKSIDPVVLGSLTRDTPAFRAFKSRLASMPRQATRR